MLKKIVSVSLFMNILASMAIANENAIEWDRFMQTFTQCDTAFFSEIHQHKNQLNQLVNIKDINDHQSYIQVQDRLSNNKNYALFTTPVQYNGLTILGYYDSAMNLGKYGDYYFWGFIFKDDIDTIRNKIEYLSWQNMEDNALYIANPKIRYAEDDLNEWHINNTTIVGVKTIPAAGTTEKLILLEKEPMTTLLCSIQGFIPLELLKSERPDIKQRPNNTTNNDND